ncbi:hypothetical protein VTN00DRAFT_8836 [Thermoascus crustaceus]|uniref:uncharacterized protein n=1 Tax=Thermoascus crustaceus TaxID=5088 RepID=UPI0037444CE9
MHSGYTKRVKGCHPRGRQREQWIMDPGQLVSDNRFQTEEAQIFYLPKCRATHLPTDRLPKSGRPSAGRSHQRWLHVLGSG